MNRLCFVLLLISPPALSDTTRWVSSMAASAPSDSQLLETGDTQQVQSMLDGYWRFGESATTVDAHLALLVEHQSQQGQSDDEQSLIVSELSLQQDLDADANWQLMVGKRRLDYGVGYGYRPLDFYRAYPRHPIGIQVEEGVVMAGISRFEGMGEFSLTLVDSDILQQQSRQSSDGQSVTLRWYQFDGLNEWQILGGVSETSGFRMGASWQAALTERLAMHSEGLYQQTYDQWSDNMPAAGYQKSDEKNGAQGLLGANWSHESGHTFILEYWYDGRARSQQQWDRLIEQAGLEYPAVSYQRHAQALLSQNLHQHNIMLHWRTAEGVRDWSASADLLYAPTDQGVIVTTRLYYYLSDHWLTQASVRYFGGQADAVYRQLPDQWQGALQLEFTF